MLYFPPDALKSGIDLRPSRGRPHKKGDTDFEPQKLHLARCLQTVG